MNKKLQTSKEGKNNNNKQETNRQTEKNKSIQNKMTTKKQPSICVIAELDYTSSWRIDTKETFQ